MGGAAGGALGKASLAISAARSKVSGASCCIVKRMGSASLVSARTSLPRTRKVSDVIAEVVICFTSPS